jgi:hypothetical protein
MYKVGDKVLYRDEAKHDVWHEGEIVMADALASDRYRVSAAGSAHWVWRYDSDIKPRTSPNELTVVVNLDASAAIADLDKFVDMMRDRMATIVQIACKGDVQAAAELVRERDALREELAACKREYADAIAVLRATEAARDERVNDLTWERDEARQKLADANAEAAGRGRACEDLRTECEVMRVERNVLNAMLTKVRAALGTP